MRKHVTSQSDTPMAVRDFREGYWYRIHNDFLRRGWGRAVGPYSTAVYNALALHANETTQQAYPSYSTIAELTGMSRNTAIKAVAELQRWNIVHVAERSKGKLQETNLVTLLDPAHWKRQVRYKDAKGRVIVKNLDQSDDAPASSSETGVSGVPGGSSDTLGAVYESDHPSAAGVHEQDEANKTHSEQDELTTHDDVAIPQFADELRRMRSLVRFLAPNFRALDSWLQSLSEAQVERLAIAVFDLLSRRGAEAALANPAGYLRSCTSDEYQVCGTRHEAEMLEHWQLACQVEDMYESGDIGFEELNDFWRQFGIAKRPRD